MKRYEVIFILRADLSTDDNKAIVTRFLDVVTKMGGFVTKLDRWGNRKLAYLIKKQSRGNYTLLEILADASVVKELERLFRIEEKVLRYMTITLQEEVSEAEVEKAAQMKVEIDEAVVETPNSLEGAPAGNNGEPVPVQNTEEPVEKTVATVAEEA